MASTLMNTIASTVNQRLYLNNDFADVYFVFNEDDETEKVPANKVILAVQSPVFNSMFFVALKETGDVEIVYASVDEFKEFLQFFYLSQVVLNVENIKARLADKYDILKRVHECAGLLENQLMLYNMCWGYQMAFYINHDALPKFCERQISIWPKEIFASESFLRCIVNTLKRILEQFGDQRSRYIQSNFAMGRICMSNGRSG